MGYFFHSRTNVRLVGTYVRVMPDQIGTINIWGCGVPRMSRARLTVHFVVYASIVKSKPPCESGQGDTDSSHTAKYIYTWTMPGILLILGEDRDFNLRICLSLPHH